MHSARTVTRYTRALLAAKLNPPAPGSAQVPREAVWEQVGQAANARVVLVRAPAGFGKTTALLQSRERLQDRDRAHVEAARLQARGVSVGWLTLDAADNDPSRFLTCLAQAIDEMTGHGAAGGRGDDDSSHADPPSALAVVENLASQAHPFALVLDDFECIQDPAVLGLVRQIIDHLPRGGQLLIGSRSLPSLSLGRLRARGQLLEIDTDSLRFSLAETIEFLSGRRNLLLPLDDLSRLHRKTEGWVAALWLASVALERREARSEFVARFSGTDQGLADYLADDVLAALPASVREFLLRTSILRHVHAPLCDALMQRTDSAERLEQLHAANLFLAPIGITACSPVTCVRNWPASIRTSSQACT